MSCCCCYGLTVPAAILVLVVTVSVGYEIPVAVRNEWEKSANVEDFEQFIPTLPILELLVGDYTFDP
jgi:hypothetical protein